MMIRHMQISTDNWFIIVSLLHDLHVSCMCQLGLLAWSGLAPNGGATGLFETGGAGHDFKSSQCIFWKMRGMFALTAETFVC